MDLNSVEWLSRGAQIANIIATVPAIYCAYGVWIQVRAPRSRRGATMKAPLPIRISVILFVVFVAIGAILNFLEFQRYFIQIVISVTAACAVGLIARVVHRRLHPPKDIIHLSDSGIEDVMSIDRARWVCVNYEEDYINIKDRVQSVVANDSMLLLNNDNLGDPCSKLHPEKGFHGKKLELRFSRKGAIEVEPNKWLAL